MHNLFLIPLTQPVFYLCFPYLSFSAFDHTHKNHADPIVQRTLINIIPVIGIFHYKKKRENVNRDLLQRMVFW